MKISPFIGTEQNAKIKGIPVIQPHLHLNMLKDWAYSPQGGCAS